MQCSTSVYAFAEDVLPDGSLNASLVAEVIASVEIAVSAGKVVVIGTWPGQLVGPFTADGCGMIDGEGARD